MHHIVKYVANLITMSSENHSLTTLPLRVSHLKTRKLYTAKLGRLTFFKSLLDIVNIAKIHSQYSRDVRGWCSDKKDKIFLSVDPFKEKNKSTSDTSSRPPVAWSRPL